MNIAQARQIPLRQLVEHLGGRFSHEAQNAETWWFSPFRPDERTASFKINEKTNKWHDFARTEKRDAHGDILDLWTDFNNLPRRDSNAIKAALQALKIFGSAIPQTYRPVSNEYARSQKNNNPITEQPRYKFLKPPGRIWMDSLKGEIARRCLSLATVNDSLQQAMLLDTKTQKTYHGFAFENDKGGFEISIPNPKKGEAFKTAIKPKAITTFNLDTCKSVSIFEGFWDYYTWLHINKSWGENLTERDGFIILNSTTMAYEAAQTLIARKNSITHVFLFMDNDKAGEKALHDIALQLEPHGLSIGSMNHLYTGWKDLSDAWMKTPNHQNFMNSNKQKIFYDTAWNHLPASINGKTNDQKRNNNYTSLLNYR